MFGVLGYFKNYQTNRHAPATDVDGGLVDTSYHDYDTTSAVMQPDLLSRR